LETFRTKERETKKEFLLSPLSLPEPGNTAATTPTALTDPRSHRSHPNQSMTAAPTHHHNAVPVHTATITHQQLTTHTTTKQPPSLDI